MLACLSQHRRLRCFADADPEPPQGEPKPPQGLATTPSCLGPSLPDFQKQLKAILQTVGRSQVKMVEDQKQEGRVQQCRRAVKGPRGRGKSWRSRDTPEQPAWQQAAAGFLSALLPPEQCVSLCSSGQRGCDGDGRDASSGWRCSDSGCVGYLLGGARVECPPELGAGPSLGMPAGPRWGAAEPLKRPPQHTGSWESCRDSQRHPSPSETSVGGARLRPLVWVQGGLQWAGRCPPKSWRGPGGDTPRLPGW